MIQFIKWWIESWKEAYENPDSIAWMTRTVEFHQE